MGFEDPRHLWPSWLELIRELRPAVLFGEQVASRPSLEWLDIVLTDLEGEDYACGATDIAAAGVGAPHIRQRLYWVADVHGRIGRMGDTDRTRLEGWGDAGGKRASERTPWTPSDSVRCRDGKRRPVEPLVKQMANGVSESMGHVLFSIIEEIERDLSHGPLSETNYRKEMRVLWEALLERTQREWKIGRLFSVLQAPLLLAFMRQLSDQGWSIAQSIPRAGEEETEIRMRILQRAEPFACTSCGRGLAEQCGREPADTMHFLSSVLARAAQKAWGKTFASNAKTTFPLVEKGLLPGRVGLLRGYGNAIVPQVAAAFIEAYLETRCLPDR
jgi:site-specific DNA-cytosine methylase